GCCPSTRSRGHPSNTPPFIFTPRRRRHGNWMAAHVAAGVSRNGRTEQAEEWVLGTRPRTTNGGRRQLVFGGSEQRVVRIEKCAYTTHLRSRAAALQPARGASPRTPRLLFSLPGGGGTGIGWRHTLQRV